MFFTQTYFRYLLLLLLFICSVVGYSQDSTSVQRKKNPVKFIAKLKSKIAFGGSWFAGNFNKADFRSTIDITNSDTIYEFNGFSKMNYTELNHITYNEEYLAGLKFDYMPFRKISPFALVSAYQGRYKGVQMRLTGLCGMKWMLFHLSKKNEFSLSTAMLYDSDNYTETALNTDREFFRVSVRPKIRYQISPSLYVENVTFYKVVVTDISDYRIESVTSISSKISEKIFWDLSFEFNYVNTPPLLKDTSKIIMKTDQAFIASLVYKF